MSVQIKTELGCGAGAGGVELLMTLIGGGGKGHKTLMSIWNLQDGR